MKKFIRILEENGIDDSLLKLAALALADCRRDSYDHLKRLCSGEKRRMASVTAGAIVIWLIKRFHERCRKDLRKNERNGVFQELNRYLDSIQLVTRLDASIDQQALRVKAVDFLSDRRKRRQALSRDLKESKGEHQKMLAQIIDAMRSGTGQSENDVHQHLSGFLNSIGFTTLAGKPFTPQNISE